MRTLLLATLVAACAHGAEWPQFLGPDRNGSTPERVAGDWSGSKPRQLWKVPVGAGFSAPVIEGGTVYLFHRIGNSEILLAIDPENGREKWQSQSSTAYRDDFGFDEGPRATPCVQGDRIFVMGAEGLIRSVDAKEGHTLWSVDAKTQFRAPKGFFGMACSPLVHGNTVILNIGGADGAGIIGLDRETGLLRWKSSRDEASYSSPVMANPGGTERVAVFTGEGLVLLNPESSAVQTFFPWRSRMHASVNAATPLVFGERIFLTASYDTGAVLLEWKNGSLAKVWSGDDSLSSHYATPVYHKGFLYGFHGRQEYGPSFRCVEADTGRVRWSEEHFGAGTVILAGESLLILRESGELVIADASPSGFRMRGALQILGNTRAAAALAGGRFYARDRNSLVCVQLPPIKRSDK